MRWILALTVALAIGCGDDGNTPHDSGVVMDAGVPDASCFENPQTHNEIINACTTAQKIYKTTKPPLLKPDGTLPALP